MEFKDKVVTITGASTGIGATCALHFAKLSANLAIVGRNEENLMHVAQECKNVNGLKPLSIIADISKPEDNERIIKETVAQFGKIDVLINNAGIMLPSVPGADTSTLDRIFATNVRGTYMLTNLAIPHLLKTKGNIINVESIVSTVPEPFFYEYCMSKAAINMFTKCKAVELAPKGVRVNSVNPGPVTTNLLKTAGLSVEQSDSVFNTLGEKLPLRKVANTDDVASMVVFLANNRSASCVTGGIHYVDCGYHLGQPLVA